MKLYHIIGLGAKYWIAPLSVATPPSLDMMFSMTLKATDEGKGKLFLDGYKEEDIYSNLP